MSSILDQDIMFLQGVGPKRKDVLNKELNIYTWRDLLEYYPYKYVDRSKLYAVSELNGEMPFVQIKGTILSFEEFEMGVRKKRLVAHFRGVDGGIVDLVWFQGVQYIKKTYTLRQEYIVFGKPSCYNGRFQFTHPEIEKAGDVAIETMRMQPYYTTTERMKKGGLQSRSVEKLTRALVDKLSETDLSETLPPAIINKYKLISRYEAFRFIHYPTTLQEVQQAQQRLKFEELFFIQLHILRYTTEKRNQYQGYVFSKVGEMFHSFYNHCLPFTLTNAQKRVVREMRNDMLTGKQMNRLLQGDVGSGKTLVALLAMLIAVGNNYQACMMAPTEILAEQHYETVCKFVKDLPLKVALLTGNVKGKKRKEILTNLLNGNIHVLIGTHAVIEDTVQFARLGLAVVDEQHRFGVAQRAKMWNKSAKPPHILVMTATPIPRTLAMTIYGDLDVSIIDELPPGRKPIQTIHKYENQTASLYEGIRREINAGRQVYIVFPLIKESEKIDLENLEDGYERLKNIFPQYKMSKIHGKMKPLEKEEEMNRFAKGETKILVATTVIEVGVNVPNATVMVILEAQRFGLSQLHQLRGRVGRGGEQSYCILVTNHKLTSDTRKRIDIMCATNDGFQIAEADLKLRGPGDLEGTRQSGMAFDLKIANLARDGQLVQCAREEASKIIAEDPLFNHPTYAMMWQRLNELKKIAMNWSSIS